ncbi:MAG: hypothetical protein MZU97_04755 [Bacillus subtilis]|nr:hypothetical protein [Bacillus subtilis]
MSKRASGSFNHVKEIGYVADTNARILKSKYGYTIGVIFSDISLVGLEHPFFGSIIQHFKTYVEKRGYESRFHHQQSRRSSAHLFGMVPQQESRRRLHRLRKHQQRLHSRTCPKRTPLRILRHYHAGIAFGAVRRLRGHPARR